MWTIRRGRSIAGSRLPTWIIQSNCSHSYNQTTNFFHMIFDSTYLLMHIWFNWSVKLSSVILVVLFSFKWYWETCNIKRNWGLIICILIKPKLGWRHECEQFVVVAVLRDLGCPPGIYNQIIHIHVYIQKENNTDYIWFELPFFAFTLNTQIG